MKVLWAVPSYCSVQAIMNSLYSPGIETKHWVINLSDKVPYPEDYNPDVIIYMGHINANELPIEQLIGLRKKAKTVNIITHGNDGSCQPYYKKYYDHDVFSLQVCVDGGENWPKRNQDYVTLPPVDPRPFAVHNKSIFCGYTHEWDSPWREKIVYPLKDIVRAPRSPFGEYQSFVNFMCQCKNWLHLSFSKDSISQKMIESAYAECNLIEMADHTGLQRYFTPGVDYTAFKEESELPDLIISNRFTHRQMRKKIEEKYSHTIFWKNLFERLAQCS